MSSFILDHRAFATFASEFFRELAERGTERLILDLRGNWGGPPRSSALLLSYLMDKPAPYLSRDAPFYYYRRKRDIAPRADAFRGDLVVLTDGAVFSTTGHLVSLLRHHERGLFIGDITGGGAMCTDGSHGMTLPNTGLRLHYATRIFSIPAAPDSDGAGIQPDIRIVPTIDDMIAGRDAVLDYVTTNREMP